jgi:hypothetical protein
MELVQKLFGDLTGIAPVLTLSLLLNIVQSMFIKWLIQSDKEKTMHTKNVDDSRIEILTNKLIEIAGKK